MPTTLHKTFPDRLAFTDLETTNSWPPDGEIIELGVVVADTKTLNVIERHNWKIQPKHIATASQDVLSFNKFSVKTWADAMPAGQALKEYLEKVSGAAICTWRVAYDFTFLYQALKDENLFSAHHFETQICVYSMALQALCHEKLESFRLRSVAKFLGIEPEPHPHRAINGAELAFEVYKKLLDFSTNKK